MKFTDSNREKIQALIDMVLKGYDSPFIPEEIDLAKSVTMGDCIVYFELNPTEANKFFNHVELSDRINKATGFRPKSVKESFGFSREQLRDMIISECCDMEISHASNYDHYHPVEADHGLSFEDSGAFEESGMIKSNLYSMASKAQSLHDMIQNGDDLPEWVQEKIAVADEMIDVIYDYLKYEYSQGHKPNKS